MVRPYTDPTTGEWVGEYETRVDDQITRQTEWFDTESEARRFARTGRREGSLLVRSEDPDGLGCYSDHAHDIKTKGACDWCTSTDPTVVGHVLPDMERLRGIDPVKAAAIVLHTESAKIVDGVLLDFQTAGAITAVHDALSEDARAKLRSMSITKAGIVCWKLVSRHQ